MWTTWAIAVLKACAVVTGFGMLLAGGFLLGASGLCEPDCDTTSTAVPGWVLLIGGFLLIVLGLVFPSRPRKS